MKWVVSQAYLDGIKEGRETLNRFKGEGVTVNPREMMDNCNSFIARLKSCAYSELNMDFLLGERDFWLARVTEELINDTFRTSRSYSRQTTGA